VSLNNRRWWNEFKEYTKYFDKARYARMGKQFAGLGLVRFFKPAPYANMPDNVRELVFEHYCQPKAYDAMIDEVLNIDQSIELIDGLPKFPDVPLKVIYPSPESNVQLWNKYGMKKELAEKMEKLHEELAHEQLGYSSHSEWVVAEKSSHAIHLDRPDLVVKEISDCIDKIRK
jgi:pimeloyl-ACP methyl ester carboxylesterase